MKRLIFLFSLLLLPLLSCSDDESTEPVVTYYALTITNKTASGYQLFQTPTEAGDGFAKTGYVLSNVNYRVTELEKDVTYTFRLVPDGGGASDYLYEKTITSDGSDQTWVIY